MMVHTFGPSIPEAEAGGSLSSRPAWSVLCVPGQPGIDRETSQKKKKYVIYVYECSVCMHTERGTDSIWMVGNTMSVLGIELRTSGRASSTFSLLSHLSSSLPINFLKNSMCLLIYLRCVYICTCVCHGTCTEDRGQLLRVTSFLQCGVWGLRSSGLATDVLTH